MSQINVGDSIFLQMQIPWYLDYRDNKNIDSQEKKMYQIELSMVIKSHLYRTFRFMLPLPVMQ